MSYIFLIIAFILLLIGISAVLSLMMIRIPPIPSSPSVIKAIIKEIQKTPPSCNITELGSGYGYMLFRLAKAFPQRQIIGIEISFIPFFFSSVIRILGRYKNVRIFYGNAFTVIEKKSLPVDIAVGYLIATQKMSDNLEKLYRKRISELLILNTYPLKNITATQTVPNLDIFKSTLYLYHKNQNIGDSK